MKQASILILILLAAGCRFKASGLPSDHPPGLDAAGSTDAADARSGKQEAAAPAFDLQLFDGSALDGRTSDGPRSEGSPADAFTGRWYQADEADCPAFCEELGLESAPGPEGASCMSGEVRPQSGKDQGITFTYGCPSSCDGELGPLEATTISDFLGTGYCYRPKQKKDWDSSDKTVACFCR